MKSILLLISILLLFSNSIKSQVFINKSTPLSKLKQNSKNSQIQARSNELEGLSSINSITPENINYLPQSELTRKINDIRNNDPNSTPIALSIDTDINIDNSGKWDTLDNGDRVWRVSFLVSEVNASILAFKELSLPYGSFMHIFDKNSDMSYGPLNFNTNSDGGGWMTHVLPFSNVVLEYVQPAEVLGKPTIVLNRVGQLVSTNIDSLTNNNKNNTIQGRMPQVPYFDESDYASLKPKGNPIACDDTLESYSRAAVQFIFLKDINNSSNPFEYDTFDLKNGMLLSTTEPTACNAYIATVAHVAWQDSSMLRDYTSFRFNWKRNKPDSSCCVFPINTDWDTTINYSKIADYCGATRRVFNPTNSQGVHGDFAIVEMLNYPIHNAYFSDWNAKCFDDSVGKNVKIVTHDEGKVPLMYLEANLGEQFCQSLSPKNPHSNLYLIPNDCITNPSIISGESGSAIMYKKNGIGLNDYEYIGSLKTDKSFAGLNWVYDIDEPSNRPKTYLDPLNTGILANAGYDAYLPCQTAECCELIYSKIRPQKVIADANDSCCANLIIEEKFPDDISCGDYTIVVRRAGTTDTLINELVMPANLRYPVLYIREICEKLPTGFLNAKTFKYDIDFIKGDSTVISCNREVEFTCEKCDPDDLEIELLPSKEQECCYDVKIKELTNDACQFKYVFFKDKHGGYINHSVSSPSSSMIGLNQDSMYIRNLCITDTTFIYLYDETIGINAWGNPYVYDENRYIKKVMLDPVGVPCNCCENIEIESSEECNEFIITQHNLNRFSDICEAVDSVSVSIFNHSGDLIMKDIYQQGNLSGDTTNTININSIFGGSRVSYRFYLFDEEGNLICEKEESNACNTTCGSVAIIDSYVSTNDDDPCCQILRFSNISGTHDKLYINVRKVDMSDSENPIFSSPINNTLIEIVKSSSTIGEIEICLEQISTTFVIEILTESDTLCKTLFTLNCSSCCEDVYQENASFKKDTSSENCCYNLELADSCNPEIQYLKVKNLNDDNLEYQGSILGLDSEEFCVGDNEPVKYKIEYFSDDDYADTNRLCIEEKTLNPCFVSCCDSAFIEPVRDTSVKDPLKCCWTFNIQNYNCDVYGVEIYNNYTYVNGYGIVSPDGSYTDYYHGKQKKDRYELGSSEFLPYYTEGSTIGDTTNGPINLDTMNQRIAQKICILNDSHEQPNRSDPNAYISENIIIKLYGKDGEECTLDTDLNCSASDACCDYVHLVSEKVIDPLDSSKCCWRFGFSVEHWKPSNCNDELDIKKFYIYRDSYDLDSSKYLSDMYPIDSPEFSPYYFNDNLDDLTSYYDLLSLVPEICQDAGTNPTDRMKIILVNSKGDTCLIDFYLDYCKTDEEAALQYTTNFDTNMPIDVNDIDLTINSEQTSIFIESSKLSIDKYNFDVYNLQGEKINFSLIDKHTINISQLSSGLYYLVFKSEKQVIAKTFTIVR